MIRAQKLNLSFGKNQVLLDVSIDVMPNQVLAVCGPNGAGKSTLLSAMVGDHPSLRNSVFYDDEPICGIGSKSLASKRAVLEQSPSLTASFSVFELLELSVPIEISPLSAKHLIQSVCTDLGLAALAHQPVNTLSGGQQHRAHLGRVLVQLLANREMGHDGFLFLDEPTASLDLSHQIGVMKSAKEMARNGVGVMVVLHDLNLAAAYADRIALMKNGQIVFVGSVDEVMTPERLSSVYETDVSVFKTHNGQLSIQPNYLAA